MSIDPITSRIEVRRVNGCFATREQDNVAIEEPLEIQIALERRGIRTVRSVSVTMRTPGNDDELAAGFLFGEGILNRRSDVERIESPVSKAADHGMRSDFISNPAYSLISGALIGISTPPRAVEFAEKLHSKLCEEWRVVSFRARPTPCVLRRRLFMAFPRGCELASKSSNTPADSTRRPSSIARAISARRERTLDGIMRSTR
jgi:hypothetical protein